MLHDPNEYPEPDSFKPERFLDQNGQVGTHVRNPSDMAFGFGRRYVISLMNTCCQFD